MNIRKLHRTIGAVFSLFFLLTALAGSALLWRKAGIYSNETKSLMLDLHNWEIAAEYAGVILAAALIFMNITGLIMFYKSRSKR